MRRPGTGTAERHGYESRPHIVRGVTLIELLIVVVIVAILAAIAYPSYRQYAQRAKRSEAMSALLLIATEQERYYLNKNEYTTVLANVGFDSDTTASGTYVLTIASADVDSTYTATATYQLADEEAAKCTSFSINATGAKTSVGTTTNCWSGTN